MGGGNTKHPAKLTPAQKSIVLQLQELVAQQDRRHGSLVTRVSEQDLIVRALVLLCKKHGLEWPPGTYKKERAASRSPQDAGEEVPD